MITNAGLDGVEAVIVDCGGTVIDRQQANVIALNCARRRCRAQPWQAQ